jgi:hypothetical protein
MLNRILGKHQVGVAEVEEDKAIIMGINFRKRIKILPGLTINFGKKGVSATIGARGASLNIGKKGIYSNLSVPGTGIYMREKISGTEAKNANKNQPTFHNNLYSTSVPINTNTPKSEKYQHNQSKPPTVTQKMRCTCGTLNEMHYKYCFICGVKLDLTLLETLNDSSQKWNLSVCPHCKKLPPAPSRRVKYCAFCGCELINT